MVAQVLTGTGRRAHARCGIRWVFILTVVALVAAFVPFAGDHARAARAIIVSATGTSTGDGSLAKPLSLAFALSAHSPARPGDEILLRGGVYQGAFHSRINGSPTAPITVRSYPSEWAVLDSGTTPKFALAITGSDVWFRDFEVTKSDPQRISAQAGAAPTDISRGSLGGGTAGDGIGVSGARTKLINLVVHDAGNGIVFLNGATDAEIYGGIIYNNGFLSTDKAWGHAIYAHNKTGALKRITDTVMFNNWGVGLTGPASDNFVNVIVDGVTIFDNGSPVNVPRFNVHIAPGGWGTLDKITLQNSTLYHRAAKGENVRLGFAGAETNLRQNGAVAVENNSVLGGRSGLVMQGWNSATVRSNKFSTAPADTGASDLVKVYTNMIDGPGYQWDMNTYVDDNTAEGTYSPAFIRAKKDPAKGWTGWRGTFTQWVQGTGYDGGSAFGPATAPGPEVSTRPNRYEDGRAFATIVNRSRAAYVQIDLSGIGLAMGQRFEVRDVQDLIGAPVARGIYDGSLVTVPMSSKAAMQPIGGSPSAVRHTAADFGVFQVRKLQSAKLRVDPRSVRVETRTDSSFGRRVGRIDRRPAWS